MLNINENSDRLVEAPNCQRFMEAWCNWRGDEAIPTRAQIKPEVLGSAMNSVTILKLESPNRALFHMASSIDEDLARRRLKGENYIEMTAPDRRAGRIERLGEIANTPCGGVGYTRIVSHIGRVANFWAVLLPVASANENSPGFIYWSIDLLSSEEWDDHGPFDELPVADTFDYFDVTRH